MYCFSISQVNLKTHDAVKGWRLVGMALACLRQAESSEGETHTLCVFVLLSCWLFLSSLSGLVGHTGNTHKKHPLPLLTKQTQVATERTSSSDKLSSDSHSTSSPWVQRLLAPPCVRWSSRLPVSLAQESQRSIIICFLFIVACNLMCWNLPSRNVRSRRLLGRAVSQSVRYRRTSQNKNNQSVSQTILKQLHHS